MSLVLSYEDIVKKFNSDLIHKLRKHGSEVNYLSLWVPDEDFLRSFESLSESIKASNVNSFILNVRKKFISKDSLLNFKTKFPNIKIEDKKDFYLIYVKNLNSIKIEKKIIDRVLDKKQIKINYSYGSLETQKPKNLVRKFFLDYYYKNFKEFSLNLSLKKKLEYFSISIDKEIIYVDFNEKEEFIRIRSGSDNKYLLGCLFFFNKIFFKKKLSHIGHHGISEFVMAVKNNCRNPINGIMLPFNFGNEVFFVNKICQKIFERFSEISVNPVMQKLWEEKTLEEKQKLCKTILKKFLKNKKEIPNSIIFNNIENDINKMPIRIIVTTSENINPRKKPDLLRRFERFIKKEIDESLQVLHEEKKDLNKIRRL